MIILRPRSHILLLSFFLCCKTFLNVFVVILGKSHYMIYSLVAAMKPRMLVTFDKDFNPLPVSVRVGQVCENSSVTTGRETLENVFFSSTFIPLSRLLFIRRDCLCLGLLVQIIVSYGFIFMKLLQV